MKSNNNTHDSIDSAEPKVQADESVKQKTNMIAMMDLVPEEDATHVAVKDGSWFDPSTWKNGKVPGDDARVMIPKGVKVDYDGISEASLFTLRVDGTLDFATDQGTQIKLDTFVVSSDGMLNIGTEAKPVQADVETRIIIADNGAIDTKWDPQQLSRGVLSNGSVNIHGAEKVDFVTLAQDVMAGDSELVLSQKPTGWAVGDQLVLGGTSTNEKGSHDDNSKFQDEVLTITEIRGNRVKFTNNDISGGDNEVLRFDHTRPDVAEKDQHDRGLMKGKQTLSLDLKNTEGDQQKNAISVSLWGIKGNEFNIISGKDDGPDQINAIPMESTQLVKETLGGESFDWKTFEWDVDLGKGYDYLVVKVNGNQISENQGDFVGIDNISLGGGNSRLNSSNGKSVALMVGSEKDENSATLQETSSITAKLGSYSESDTASLRLNDISSTSIGLGLQEETSVDSGLAHTQDSVAFL